MNDRELLELAAKAACLKIDKSKLNGGGVGNAGFDMLGNAVLDWHNGVTWNPLTDDGDALRLAVQLEMLVESSDWGAIAATGDGDPHYAYVDGQSVGVPRGDRRAAMRRAIVRAAAEIGRGMVRK